MFKRKHPENETLNSHEQQMRDTARAQARRVIELLRQEPPEEAPKHFDFPDYNLASQKLVTTDEFTGVAVLTQYSDGSINPEAYTGEDVDLRILGITAAGAVVDFGLSEVYSITTFRLEDDIVAMNSIIAELESQEPTN